MSDDTETAAPRIELFTTPWCGSCLAARRLLAAKGVTPVEVDLTEHPELRLEVARRSGRSTVPQVFVDGRSIGGYDDLLRLDRSGELDGVLKGLRSPGDRRPE